MREEGIGVERDACMVKVGGWVGGGRRWRWLGQEG